MHFSTFLSILTALFVAAAPLIPLSEGWHVKVVSAEVRAAAQARKAVEAAPDRQLAPAQSISDTPTLIEMTHAASALGALASCRHSKLYDSALLDDSIKRHFAVYKAIQADEDNDNGMGIAQVWPLVFNQNRDHDVYVIPVTEGEGEDMRVAQVEKVAMDSEANCRAVEADLKRWREPGGILDVAPFVPGQDA